MNTSVVPQRGGPLATGPADRTFEVDQVDWEDALRRHFMGTDIQLNSVFVEQVGTATALRFRDALIRVGTRCRHHERGEIRAALAAAFAQIGVEVGPVELEKYADEISRSEAVTAHL